MFEQPRPPPRQHSIAPPSAGSDAAEKTLVASRAPYGFMPGTGAVDASRHAWQALARAGCAGKGTRWRRHGGANAKCLCARRLPMVVTRYAAHAAAVAAPRVERATVRRLPPLRAAKRQRHAATFARSRVRLRQRLRYATTYERLPMDGTTPLPPPCTTARRQAYAYMAPTPRRQTRNRWIQPAHARVVNTRRR